MKLQTAIEEIHLRHTFTISRESQDVVRVVTVELSDGELSGFGEASPSSFYGAVSYTHLPLPTILLV